MVRAKQNEVGLKETIDAEIAVRSRQRKDQRSRERRGQREGMKMAREFIVGGVDRLLFGARTTSAEERRKREKQAQLLDREKRRLQRYSSLLQEYYMYDIKIKVGIIYQLKINIAILDLLTRVFVCSKKEKGVCRINDTQIARINQLINFSQKVMGGFDENLVETAARKYAKSLKASADSATREGEDEPAWLNEDGQRALWQACKSAGNVAAWTASEAAGSKQSERLVSNAYFKNFLPGIENWSPSAAGDDSAVPSPSPPLPFAATQGAAPSKPATEEQISAARAAAAEAEAAAAEAEAAAIKAKAEKNQNPLQKCITRLHKLADIKTRISYTNLQDEFFDSVLRFDGDSPVVKAMYDTASTLVKAQCRAEVSGSTSAYRDLCDFVECYNLYNEVDIADGETISKYFTAWPDEVKKKEEAVNAAEDLTAEAGGFGGGRGGPAAARQCRQAPH